MLCDDCQAASNAWLDYRAPDHLHRWKGQCCINRADDAGNGACRKCADALRMRREERARFIREQRALIARICKEKHQ